jgi:hypothetical protein
MDLHCPKCREVADRFFCKSCASTSSTPSRDALQRVHGEMKDVRGRLDDLLIYRCGKSDRVANLLLELSIVKAKLLVLAAELESRTHDMSRRKCILAEMRDLFEQRKKRMTPRQDNTIPFGTYMREHHRFDRTLSSLHPFRKLRGVAQTLFEERRAVCIRLLSLFRFRLLNVHEDSSSVGDVAGVPTTELVGDFYTMDGQKDQLHIVLLFIVPLVILLCQILEIPLPFPLAYGTLSSSFAPSTPPVVHPVVLSPHKNQVSPIDQGIGLLIENLRYVAGITNQAFVPFGSELMTLLSTIFTSTNLGRVIHKEPGLLSSFPSSPSISASNSPLLSSSYRKAVIEQSLTEGGEWTLLDQL